MSEQTSESPGEPDRSPPPVEGDGPEVHTGDDEGHPAGDGERTDREIGGPTSPDDPPESDEVEGGGKGASPGSGFEPH